MTKCKEQPTVDEVSFVIHYGGKLQTEPSKLYMEGKSKFHHKYDVDKLSYFELIGLVKDLTPKAVGVLYYRIPGRSFVDGLVTIHGDNEVNELIEAGKKCHGFVEVYVDHKEGNADILTVGGASGSQIKNVVEPNSASQPEVTSAQINKAKNASKASKPRCKEPVLRKIPRSGRLRDIFPFRSYDGVIEITDEELVAIGEEVGFYDQPVLSQPINEEEQPVVSDPINPNVLDDEHRDNEIDTNQEADKGNANQEVDKGNANQEVDKGNANQEVDIKFEKRDRTRLVAKCAPNCEWFCRSSWMQNERSFQVKTMVTHHTCVRNFSTRLATANWLARQFATTIRDKPRTKVSDLVKKAKDDFKVDVSFDICNRAKKKAFIEVDCALKQHYARLWDYGLEILRSNPGSSVTFGAQERTDHSTPAVFERAYVCFDALKKGWLNGCRPVIGLDGCFLKTFVKGQLLTAVGRDGNNHMFPIAWAVVESENYSSWTYFLEQLKAYDFALNPVNGERLWPLSTCEPMLPPKTLRLGGRPKRARRREQHEHEGGGRNPVPNPVVSVPRKGRRMRCSNCNEFDHNARGCKNLRVENDMELQRRRKKLKKNEPAPAVQQSTSSIPQAPTQANSTAPIPEVVNQVTSSLPSAVDGVSAANPSTATTNSCFYKDPASPIFFKGRVCHTKSTLDALMATPNASQVLGSQGSSSVTRTSPRIAARRKMNF